MRSASSLERREVTASDVPFHVTIVHPRTSDHGAAAFAALRGETLSGSVAVSELCWTETSPERMTVLERFQLMEPADRPTSTWSGGQKRRLDIAIGLVHRPPGC